MAALTSFGFLLIAAVAWYVATDPFQHSVGHGVKHFEPQYIAAPTYDILQNFSRDTDSKLEKAELKWRGEFWGPESVTFDSRGRGPYTGISDGRVMRYDGPELGWSTFAYTSRNRCGILFHPAVSGTISCSSELFLQFSFVDSCTFLL
jgi:hypothetical protein